MVEPTPSRPHMPAYGVSNDPDGMLPWAFAEERLVGSHDYWLATVWPDGRPHVMPVWGAWYDEVLWFSTAPTSRKGRNLATEPRCVATTNDPLEPVVVDGTAAPVPERQDVERFTAACRSKYATEWDDDAYTVDFFADSTYRLTPVTVFSLRQDQFATSPTRWTFSP